MAFSENKMRTIVDKMMEKRQDYYLEVILLLCNNENEGCNMWEVEYTDEFEGWWEGLRESEQIDVAAYVGLLEKCGPQLTFPYSSGINSSRHSHMRELRVQHQGKPYRILYAFDPRRTAILLLGGNKTGDDRWYEKSIQRADYLYNEHLQLLNEEGLIDESIVQNLEE
jgi:hypothetical protein